MSVGLSDIFGSNVLDESRFKPWWEKIREYALRGLMVTSFLALSVELTAKQTQCSPRYPNPNYTMSSTQSQVANELCYHQQDWKVNFSGVIAVFASTILYACFSSWLIFPSVIAGFLTVKRVDDAMIDKQIIPKRVVENVTLPLIRDEKTARNIEQVLKLNVDDQVRDELQSAIQTFDNRDAGQYMHLITGLCREVYIPKRWCSIPCLYLIRNVLSVSCASVILALDVKYYILEWRNASNSFYCSLSHEDVTVIGLKELFCSTDLALRLYPYSILYSIFTSALLLVSLFASGWALCNLCHDTPEQNEDITKSILTTMDCYFFERFAESSRSLHESTIQLLRVSSDEEVLKQMNYNYDTAIIFGDSVFLDLYISIHKNGTYNVEKFLTEKSSSTQIKNSSLPAPRRSEVHGMEMMELPETRGFNKDSVATELGSGLLEALKNNSRTRDSELIGIIKKTQQLKHFATANV